MIEIIKYQFFQNAVLAIILSSIAAGIIGTYIVIKRMSLISGSIAHAAFGGLGISYFFNLNPLIGGTIFSLVSSMSIALFLKKARHRIDVLLSFLWSTGMAIGLLFIFLKEGYNTDLFSYLFGNILLVSRTDLIIILILNLLIIIIVYLMYNSIMSVIFDEEFSETKNLNITLINMILFGLIALTIIASIRITGIILMIAVLTIPAATSQMIFRNVKKIMVSSSLIILFSGISGLFLSYYLNISTSPIIVLILSFFYLVSLLVSKKIN